MVGDPERDQGQRALDEQPAADVAVDLVAELVREHRLDLVGGELVEQGVEEQDAPGAAEARPPRRSRCGSCATGRRPTRRAPERRPARQRAARARADAVGERGEAVEERDQPDRSGEGEQGVAREEEQGAPEPPPGGRAQQRVHDHVATRPSSARSRRLRQIREPRRNGWCSSPKRRGSQYPETHDSGSVTSRYRCPGRAGRARPAATTAVCRRRGRPRDATSPLTSRRRGTRRRARGRARRGTNCRAVVGSRALGSSTRTAPRSV